MSATRHSLTGVRPSGSGGATEDSELELLELQLEATLSAGSKQLKGKSSCLPTYPCRRKSPESLMTLWADRSLLEDVQTEQSRLVLTHIGRWDFNAFTLDRLTSGRNLSTLCSHLFHERGIFHHFGLDVLAVNKFFYLVEQGYHRSNPYHNGVHAADVTQAMHCFLLEKGINRHLEPLEILAAIIAAATHDLDHPGRNEKFLIATSSHLAGTLYGSAASVLENHHWRSAISLLWESGIAQCLRDSDRINLQEMVRELILATDISRQQEFLGRFRSGLDGMEKDSNGGLNLAKHPEDRLLVLQIAMKCADISNPCRPWNISRLWSYRACEEFFRQGDKERELGLNVTPFCDRFNMSVAKVQAGFYRMVASPLFEEWNRFLSSSLSTSMIHNLTSNQARWDLIVQQETRSSSIMIESSTSSSSTGTASNSSGGTDSRRESLEPPHPHCHHHASRSSIEGDDDSDPCSSYPYLPLDATAAAIASAASSVSAGLFIRRHSLPLSSTRGFSRTSSEDSSDEVSAPAVVGPSNNPAYLQRQHSLFPRALSRFPRQSDLAIQSSFGRPSHKRRLFASSRSPIQTTLESESAGSSFESDPLDQHNNNRVVTFHFGPREEDEAESENRKDGEANKLFKLEEEDDKENNANLLSVSSCTFNRRGSAPGSLLLVGLSPSAASSRENSPNGAGVKRKSIRQTNFTHLASSTRRGSLPVDLIQGQSLLKLEETRSSSCGRKDSTEDEGSGKKRKVQRRRSGGAEPLSQSNNNKENAPWAWKRPGSFQLKDHNHRWMMSSWKRGFPVSKGDLRHQRQSSLEVARHLEKQHVLKRNASLLEEVDLRRQLEMGQEGSLASARRGSLPAELSSLDRFIV